MAVPPLTRCDRERAPAPGRPVPQRARRASATPQQAAYDALVASGLKLDLTRGKPSADAARPRPTGCSRCPTTTTRRRTASTPATTAGSRGSRELRAMFAELLWLEPEQLVAAQGNSSLALMQRRAHRPVAQGRRRLRAAVGRRRRRSRFICPVPGYDRHFTLLEWFGIEMVHGADDRRRPRRRTRWPRWSPTTRRIKGIWVVPTYANPTGSGHHPGGRRAARLDADGGARTSRSSGTTPTRSTTSPRPRPRAPTSCRSRRSPATRTGRSSSPRPPRSPTPAPASRSSAGSARDRRAGTSANLGNGSIGPDKVNQLRHAAVLRHPAGRARPHGASTAQLHRARSSPRSSGCSHERLGGLGIATWTRPDRRLLRQPRRAGRHRDPRHRARQGRPASR